MDIPFSDAYPKPAVLRDGTPVLLRLMTRHDRDRLMGFLATLPPEDRRTLRDNVADPAVVDAWVRRLDYSQVIPILAEIDERIVGDGTLHRAPHGWSRHVGEIRLVVDPRCRRRGLGALLAREIFFLAVQLQLRKIVAEMPADQGAAIRVFEALGFRREAVLKDHVQDLQGTTHDLLILSNHVASLWDRIQDHILEAHTDFSGD